MQTSKRAARDLRPLLGQRHLHGEHDPGTGERFGGIRGDLGAGGGELAIGNGRLRPGARLDRDREAEADQALHRIGRRRDARLERAAFLQHRKAHPINPSQSDQPRREEPGTRGHARTAPDRRRRNMREGGGWCKG